MIDLYSVLLSITLYIDIIFMFDTVLLSITLYIDIIVYVWFVQCTAEYHPVHWYTEWNATNLLFSASSRKKYENYNFLKYFNIFS